MATYTSESELYRSIWDTTPGPAWATEYRRMADLLANGQVEQPMGVERKAHAALDTGEWVLTPWTSQGRTTRVLEAAHDVPDGQHYLLYYDFATGRISGDAPDQCKRLAQSLL